MSATALRHSLGMTTQSPQIDDPAPALLASRPAGRPPSLGLAPALAIGAVLSMTQLDVTALAVALPVIDRDLHLGPVASAWVMDAYSLAFASLLLAAGALADRFGRRRALLLGTLLFAAASALAALAWDGPTLWFARAAQGAAAALLLAGGLSVLSLAYPEPAGRARAFGLMGTISGAAMALGPAVGGLLASLLGWQWIFILNLPVCLVAGWAVIRLVRESLADQPRPVDLPGLLMLSLAISLPVHAALGAGASPWQWAEFSAAVVMAVAFACRQRSRAVPLLDPALLARPPQVGTGLVLVFLSVGYWAVLVHLPRFFEAAFGLESRETGFAMLVATLPMVFLPPLGARMVQRWGFGFGVAAGLAVVSAATAGLAMAVWSEVPSLPLVLGLASAAGAGAGLINSQVSAALVAMAPRAQAGMASAVATILRQAGFALGIALLGVAVQAEVAGGPAYARSFLIASAAALAAVAVAVLLLRERPPTGSA